MTGALNKPLKWVVGAGALALLLMAIAAGPARAATYGSSTFSGSLEGWEAVKSECKVLGVVELELLCKNENGYDGGNGNPAGALSSKGKVLLNIGGVFKSDTTWESPAFTVAEGGQGAVNLQRAFDPGGLAELNPTLSYTATLVDKTSGQRQEAIKESLTATSTFASKSAGISLVAGHRYAVVLETDISASLAGVSLGASAGQFDNISVTGPGEGGGGSNGNGSNGSNGGEGASDLTDSRLESLLKSSLSGSAAVKGNRVFVKAKCPAKVGVACKVTVQGLLKKGRPATAPRTAKIAKGKSKQLVLKLKPKLNKVLAKRRNLLFKETVKAAKAKATVYKRLKLIRH
ncbi:MAG TPA: hypothetical protein VGG40_06775 [Solirubrobacterales bacterium]